MRVTHLGANASAQSRLRLALFSAVFTIFLTIGLTCYKLFGVSVPLAMPHYITDDVGQVEPAIVDADGDGGYVAICLVLRDLHRDLPEFLVHHYHHLDIRSFYIIDEGSNPPLSNVSDLGIPTSAVTFIRHSRQEVDARNAKLAEEEASDKPSKITITNTHSSYDECIARFGMNHTWMAYLDVDEYLEMTQPNLTLKSFLHDFEVSTEPLIGAVAVNTLIHNSNHHAWYTNTTARQTYTSCLTDKNATGHISDNKHVKSIVRTSLYSATITDHNFNTTRGSSTVGENWDVVPWIFRTPITRDKIALHHYGVKSREDYLDKTLSGYVEEPHTFPVPDDWWKYIESQPRRKCIEMAKYDP